MCCQDAPERGMTPTALRWRAGPQIPVTGWRPCSRVTEMIKTCWEVKVPKVHCFECVWVDWGLLDWTFPMDLSITLTAALQQCGWTVVVGERQVRCSWIWEEVARLEGWKDLRRGEVSTFSKPFEGLAAVGRAAVFPKSPPNRKTVFFFHCTRATSTPQPKARTRFELTGGRNRKSFY